MSGSSPRPQSNGSSIISTSTTEDPRIAKNKACLRTFYHNKDPSRVKNVDPLFARYEDTDIMYALRDKYGTVPAGWDNGDPDASDEEEKSPSMLQKLVGRVSSVASSKNNDGKKKMSKQNVKGSGAFTNSPATSLATAATTPATAVNVNNFDSSSSDEEESPATIKKSTPPSSSAKIETHSPESKPEVNSPPVVVAPAGVTVSTPAAVAVPAQAPVVAAVASGRSSVVEKPPSKREPTIVASTVPVVESSPKPRVSVTAASVPVVVSSNESQRVSVAATSIPIVGGNESKRASVVASSVASPAPVTNKPTIVSTVTPPSQLNKPTVVATPPQTATRTTVAAAAPSPVTPSQPGASVSQTTPTPQRQPTVAVVAPVVTTPVVTTPVVTTPVVESPPAVVVAPAPVVVVAEPVVVTPAVGEKPAVTNRVTVASDPSKPSTESPTKRASVVAVSTVGANSTTPTIPLTETVSAPPQPTTSTSATTTSTDASSSQTTTNASSPRPPKTEEERLAAAVKLKKAQDEQAAALLLIKKADEERAAAIAALQRAADDRKQMAEEAGVEDEQTDEVGALISSLSGGDGNKRVTLYEKKMAAIQSGHILLVEEQISAPGRKSGMFGNLVGRITGRQQKPETVSSIKLVAAENEPELASSVQALVPPEPEMINGYKKPPRDSPDLVKYMKMTKAGLPQGAVELSMMRDGFHPSAMFDDPMNKPKPKEGATSPASTAPPATSPSSSNNAPTTATQTPIASSTEVPEINGYKKPPKDSPDLLKYTKMTKAGLPQGAVELSMMRDGFHPSALFDDPMNKPGPLKTKPAVAAVVADVAEAGPASSTSAVASTTSGSSGLKRPPKDSPELAKYVKMNNAGLPQGAVENAMIREGFHPAALFDQPINDPDKAKPKTPATPSAKKSPAVAAAAPVAAAPSGDPNKMPSGLSMMEEMKWKQAHKAPAKPFVEPVKAAPPTPAEPLKPLGVGPMPAGLSMMEEMKWKQAAKALKGDAPPVEIPKKAEVAKAVAPVVALKSVSPSTTAKSSSPSTTTTAKPITPAVPTTTKPGASSLNKPSSPNPVTTTSDATKGVTAVVAMLVKANINADNAKKYAQALAKEGYDSPEKLPLLDEADLVACGVTTRFDIKIILQLKTTVSLAPSVVAAAPAVVSKPTNTGVSSSASTITKPAVQSMPTKPVGQAASTISKPVAAPAPNVKPAVSAGPKPSPSATATATDGGDKKSPFGPSVGGADKRAKEEKEKAERMAMALALTAPVKPIEKKPVGKR